MVGPVPEHDQVMSMGRSPNVVCTWVTLFQGMATIAIMAEDVFLSTDQIRNGTHEPLFSLKEHPLNMADLRAITFDTCGSLLQKALPSQRALSEGSGSYEAHQPAK